MVEFNLTGKQVMRGVKIVDDKGTYLKSATGILYKMVTEGVLVKGTHFEGTVGRKEKYVFSRQTITDLKASYDVYYKKYTPGTRFTRLFLKDEDVASVTPKEKTKETTDRFKLLAQVMKDINEERRIETKILREENKGLLAELKGLRDEISALRDEVTTKDDVEGLFEIINKISMGPPPVTETESTSSRALAFAVRLDNNNEVEALNAINQYLDHIDLRYETEMYRDVVPMMKLLRIRYEKKTGFMPRIKQREINGEFKNIDSYADCDGLSEIVAGVVEQVLKDHGIRSNREALTATVGEISGNREKI